MVAVRLLRLTVRGMAVAAAAADDDSGGESGASLTGHADSS